MPVFTAPASPQYVVTDLGTLGGQECYAQALNNKGQVVGSSQTAQRTKRAFLWSAGKMTSLGILPHYLSSFATQINEAGQVIGYLSTSSGGGHGFTRAFLWQHGKIHDLGALPGDTYSDVTSINNRGQIVGTSYKIVGHYDFLPLPQNVKTASFLRQKGKMTRLPINDAVAVAINDAGQLLVIARTGGRVFLYQKGKQTELGTLGGKLSEATYLDSKGQVVGQSQVAGGKYHAYLYSQGHMTDLGTLGGPESNAYGINRQGQIVGESKVSAGRGSHAFLWANGKMGDLNTYVPADFAWTLTRATAINDIGQILCQGEAKGRTHSFLLTPKGRNP